MNEDTNFTSGISKTQFVFYVLIATVVVVLFGYVVSSYRGNVSDMPPAATSTLQVVSSMTSMPPSAASTTAVSTPAPEPFTFEIVATPSLRSQGLSGRANIEPNYGMLFVFPSKDRYGFWMKDMQFSIDIIWLSDTGDGTATIVGIEENVSPSTYPSTFTAPEPVRYVLEMRAGETARLSWRVGTRLTLPSGIPVPQ